MPEKPRLLWHSNAPWSSTGYGIQTALFTPRLTSEYDLRISSFYGLSGAPLVWDDIVVLPGLDGTFGNESILPHVRQFFDGNPRDGLVVALMDVWVLNPTIWSQLNLACWVPVDHEPAPPRVVSFFEQTGAIPICMSRFGQQQLGRFDPLYVPHAVDTEVFQPLSKEEARAKLGVDQDGFVVGIVAANKGEPSRKSLVESLQAFAELRRDHPDAYLYLHTGLSGELSGGVSLDEVITAVGVPEEAIRLVDQYRVNFKPLAPESMALMYSAMDVLLSPSTGEGFGIPTLEAQSCGVPVIVTDATAMQEVCGAGWKVECERIWTAQKSWQFRPSVPDIADALKQAYGLSAAARKELSEKARTHAETYDVDRVLTEHMLPALEEARERFSEREPVKLKAVA